MNSGNHQGLDHPTDGEGAGDGKFRVTFEADPWGTGTPTKYDVDFSWDGEASYASFVWDISEHEDLSPASSSPVPGWISWIADGKVAIALEHTELGVALASMVETPELDASDLSSEAPWATMASAITKLIAASL